MNYSFLLEVIDLPSKQINDLLPIWPPNIWLPSTSILCFNVTIQQKSSKMTTFPTQFSILFQMVGSILFRLQAQKVTFPFIEISKSHAETSIPLRFWELTLVTKDPKEGRGGQKIALVSLQVIALLGLYVFEESESTKWNCVWWPDLEKTQLNRLSPQHRIPSWWAKPRPKFWWSIPCRSFLDLSHFPMKCPLFL